MCTSIPPSLGGRSRPAIRAGRRWQPWTALAADVSRVTGRRTGLLGQGDNVALVPSFRTVEPPRPAPPLDVGFQPRGLCRRLSPAPPS